MPLYASSAAEAIKRRKANEYSFWGSRDAANRVDPIASPHFDFPASIDRGDKIFTIGSCFARNVEGKLAAAGYRLPMRDVLHDKSFAGVPPQALNNFSAPSIWNELAWATGALRFDPDQAIVEHGPDKWIDLHVTHNVLPAPKNTVLRRRAAITRAYASFTDCKVIVITLGLVEVWYDRLTGTYLNRIPPPQLIQRSADRFELHALNHAETLDYCDRAIRLLRKHGRPDLAILMSVSPVGLAVTHRPQDVMVANCYSKSVLRAVTEELVARYDTVHYFPSYESVLHSNRDLAWANDFVHVTDTLIAHNVDRLVSHFAGPEPDDGDLAAVREAIAAGGASSAYLQAMEARKREPAAAARFFAEFGEWSARSPTFATEHAEWLVDQRQAEPALAIASAAEAWSERMEMVKARALLLLKQNREALAVLYHPKFAGSRSNRYWSLRTEAEGSGGSGEALEATLAGWSQALPKRAAQARLHVARALLVQSSAGRALELLELTLVDDPRSALGHILSTEAHLLRGDLAAARRSFAAADPATPSETRRYNKLKDRIGELVGT